MPPEGAGDSAMEYYSNAAIEKKAVANRFIGLRLILRAGSTMRASGMSPREEAAWLSTMERYERARRLIEEEDLRASSAARRPAGWLLPPKPEEDARPPAPEPDAAPFTKEELIDGIADCVAALLAQRDEKIAELGGKLDAVLQILGTGKSGDLIIDLPKNFWR